MITILVGRALPDHNVDVDLGEWHMMPRDIVYGTKPYLLPDSTTTLRTYTDVIINYIGELIEDGDIPHENVVVITEHGTHTFDSKGVIDSNWPHGIFNY